MTTRRRSEQYKPLLLSTTMRNPERIRPFLEIIKKFDGQVLTNDLCIAIEGELIRKGLYQPNRRSPEVVEKWRDSVDLEDHEGLKILEDNPQRHGEAGFAYGWPSRFDTHFALMKRFGFVFYKIGEKVEFSELGNLFIERISDSGAESDYKYEESFVFLNAFVNYHRRNPFQRILNHNRPLVLLLRVIKQLELKLGPDSPGIARHELPFLLVWRDDDYVALTDFIVEFRQKHKFSPSEETVFENCEKILGRSPGVRMHTLVAEEPDEILRKFRLTGLFSLRGNGRFVSLNSDQSQLIEYILAKHSALVEFSTEIEYFHFASRIDTEMLRIVSVDQGHSAEVDELLLDKWVAYFGLDQIKRELVLLSKKRPSTHDLLKLVSNPVRLEFLTALHLRASNPLWAVLPHYRSDDEGFPTSHAPGNTPDIEVFVEGNVFIYEVTLITGRSQLTLEMIPITRHLESRRSEFPGASMVFIAPSIHADANRYSDYLLATEGLFIRNQSIEEFVA